MTAGWMGEDNSHKIVAEKVSWHPLFVCFQEEVDTQYSHGSNTHHT